MYQVLTKKEKRETKQNKNLQTVCPLAVGQCARDYPSPGCVVLRTPANHHSAQENLNIPHPHLFHFALGLMNQYAVLRQPYLPISDDEFHLLCTKFGKLSNYFEIKYAKIR